MRIRLAPACLLMSFAAFVAMTATSSAATPPTPAKPAPAPSTAKPAPAPAKPAPAAAAPAAATATVWDKQADLLIATYKERLKLSDDQAGKVRPLLSAHLARLKNIFDSYSGETINSAPALMGQFKQARAGFKANLEPILAPEQMKELMTIRKEIDQVIRSSFVDARLGAFRGDLGISEQQAAQARPILEDAFDKRLEILSWHADSTSPNSALWPQLQKVQAEIDARLKAVFTPKQMEAYLAARSRNQDNT